MSDLDDLKDIEDLFEFIEDPGDIDDYGEPLTPDEMEELGISVLDLERLYLEQDINENGFEDVLEYYWTEYTVSLQGGILIEAEHYLLMLMSILMRKIKEKHCE